MVLYSTLIVTGLFAAMLVYRYDLYDREPWPMLLLAATAGFGVMWLLGDIEQWTIDLFRTAEWHNVVVSAVASTHEEGARLLIVALIAWLIPRHFNDPMDGIIYGSIVGLGMAIEESMSYLQLWRTPLSALPPATEFVRYAGHLVLGGITGFGVGMARMKMARWPRVLAGCLAVSLTIHFLWDWLAFTAGPKGKMEWHQTLAAVVLMGFGLLFYGMLVVVGSDWSRRVFDPHSVRQLWGWPITLLMTRKNDPTGV